MNISKKNGFSILGVILIIVAIIVAIGVWALSGQSNTSNTNASSDILASSLVIDSRSIMSEYEKLVISQKSNDASITFQPGVSDINNFVNADNGFPVPNVPAQAVIQGTVEPRGIYVFSKAFNANLGDVNQPDHAITVAGVKDSVCQKINLSLHASTDIPVFTALSDSGAFVQGATASNPNTSVLVKFNDGGTAVSGLGWVNGCIKGNNGATDDNFYFQILKST